MVASGQELARACVREDEHGPERGARPPDVDLARNAERDRIEPAGEVARPEDAVARPDDEAAAEAVRDGERPDEGFAAGEEVDVPGGGADLAGGERLEARAAGDHAVEVGGVRDPEGVVAHGVDEARSLARALRRGRVWRGPVEGRRVGARAAAPPTVAHAARGTAAQRAARRPSIGGGRR